MWEFLGGKIISVSTIVYCYLWFSDLFEYAIQNSVFSKVLIDHNLESMFSGLIF